MNFPNVGGAVRAIWADIANPDVCWAGLDMGALFKTEDAGLTWRRMGEQSDSVNPGAAGYEYGYGLKGDPTDPDVLWSASGEIYVTRNGGRSWSVADTDPARTRIAVHDLAVDPGVPGRVYAISDPRWHDSCHVNVTADGGQTWRLVRPVPGTPIRTFDIEVIPGADGKVLLATGCGLYFSTDCAATWRKVSSFPSTKVNYLSVTPWGDVYAMVPGGAYVSSDRGETWRALTENGLGGMFARLPSDERWGMVPYPDGRLLLFANEPYTLYRSNTARTGWEQICNPRREWYMLPIPEGLEAYDPVRMRRLNHWFQLLSDNPDYEAPLQPWSPATMTAAVSPADPNRIWLGTHAGVFRSDDAGKSFTACGVALAAPRTDDRWNGYDVGRTDATYTLRGANGLDLLVPHRMACDPFDPQEMAVAYYDVGVRLTRDGGVTSESLYDPRIMHNIDRVQGYDVIYDPRRNGRLYFAASDIFRSDDHGRTWRRMHIAPAWAAMDNLWRSGLSSSALTVGRMALDPFDSDGRRMVATVRADTLRLSRAGAFPDKVCHSGDGGETWSVAEGLPEPIRPLELMYDTFVSNRLWLGCNGGSADGLWRSDDGGAHWTQVGAGVIGGIDRSAIAVTRDAIYVCCYPPDGPNGFWNSSTVFKSTDGGVNWRPVATGLITSVAADPLHPGRIWIARPRGQRLSGAPAGIFYADDDTEWHNVMMPLPTPRPRVRLEFDPHNPRRLIVYTPVGVWTLLREA